MTAYFKELWKAIRSETTTSQLVVLAVVWVSVVGLIVANM